ncbi:MAG: hypothetical protein HQM15_03000 [Deltaproteobacteria bacterium]|nr:hypothetical protein [Deltaproteobacteria bacterium]
MGIGINSNDALRSLGQLGQIGKKLEKSNEKLSSGNRINQAYDDVVGLLRAESLTSSINESQINQSMNEQAQGALGVSEGGLFQNLEQLQNLRDLAVQASDSSVDSGSRQVIVGQANDNLAAMGSAAPSIDLSSSTEAKNSIGSLDLAIEHIASQLAASGSESQALEADSRANQTAQENLSQARSSIQDTEFASEASNNMTLQVNRALVLKVLQRTNEQKKSLLNLIA